jgi:hypothetical protein
MATTERTLYVISRPVAMMKKLHPARRCLNIVHALSIVYTTAEFCSCQVVNLVGEYFPATNAPYQHQHGSYIFSFGSRVVVNVLEQLLRGTHVYGSIMYLHLVRPHHQCSTNTLAFRHK